MAARNLGELLVRENLINLQQLEEAMREQKKTGGRLGAALVKSGALDDRQLVEFLGRQYQVPAVDLNSFEVDPDAARVIPKEICEKYGVVAISKAGSTLVVAFADPTNVFAKDDIAFITKCRVEQVVASEVGIAKAIEKIYPSQPEGGDLGEIFTELERSEDAFTATNAVGHDIRAQGAGPDQAPVVRFVNAILAEAIESKASDIHIEPYEKRMRVRYRVDGRLREKTAPPPGLGSAIVARIKVMAKLDIAERRRPQDGRIKVLTKRGDIDFRVSVLPTLWGEKVVLRLLDKSNLQLDMMKLGFESDDLEKFRKAIRLPQGMVLITGPTGSGKTSTIYSALAELNTPEKNISTAEDPVEFNLDGINQVQINHEIEFGFADALRSFLRQDPNVIMVGEIRDLETAEIAFKAASTGHMVVSTLHTNGAAATVVRLLDMGMPNYLIGATVSLIVAQRLIRTNCPSCSQPIEVDPKALLDLGVPEEDIPLYELRKGDGCDACGGTGLKGRRAIYEILEMSGPVRDAIMKSVTPSELRTVARRNGMRTLREAALLKLRAGQTTIEQVIAITMGDD